MEERERRWRGRERRMRKRRRGEWRERILKKKREEGVSERVSEGRDRKRERDGGGWEERSRMR